MRAASAAGRPSSRSRSSSRIRAGWGDHTAAALGQALDPLAVLRRRIAGHPAHHDAVARAGGVELRRLGRIHFAEAPFHVIVQILRIHIAPLGSIGGTGADPLHQKAGVGRQVLPTCRGLALQGSSSR